MLKALLWLVVLPFLNAETVTVRSGNGSIGGRDGSVTFSVGPANADFGKALAPGDFLSAQNGPAAYILSRNPLWIAALSSDPSAKWIDTNSSSSSTQGNTALYAVKLTITNPFTSAVLALHYAVDDALGGQNNAQQPNPGVYLNGVAICGNLISNDATDLTQEHVLNCNDIGPQLLVGTNWLCIDAVNLGGSAGLLFSATINAVNVTVPSINPGGIVSNATGGSPIAPGSIASAYGSYPITASTQSPSWPLNVAGLSILFGGIPAPIAYASGGLVNLQVPWEIAGLSQVDVTATAGTQTSGSRTTKIATFAPGIFSTNAQGKGQGAILDGSYKIVDASNPAVSGSTTIQIFCTGLGPVTNQPATGSVALSSPLSETTTTPVVTIGGLPTPVQFAGLTPTGIGLYQVNALVPTGTTPGLSVPVNISIGGVLSNTVTIAVQSPPVPNPVPSITSLSPTSAPAGVSLTLTINGTGFISGSTVSFNGSSPVITSRSTVRLTVVIPTSQLMSAGTFPVFVTNPSPGGGSSNVVNLTVTPAPSGLSGSWSGAWGSVASPGALGLMAANLLQTGTALTGSVSLDSICFPGGPLSGSVTGTSVAASITISGIKLATLSGTVSANATTINGAYAVTSGSCTGDFGIFTLTRSQ